MSEQNTDVKSLAHTKWNCKYHVVFAPKYRRRNLSGPYPFTSEYPAQNERFGIHGIFKGKEQSHDISKIRKYEICIPKPRVLVQGILCRYSRKEHCSNKKLYSQPTKAR